MVRILTQFEPRIGTWVCFYELLQFRIYFVASWKLKEYQRYITHWVGVLKEID